MKIEIKVTARELRGASKLAMDIKDALKPIAAGWVEDYIVDREFKFTLNVFDPDQYEDFVEEALRPIFYRHATFLDRVVASDVPNADFRWTWNPKGEREPEPSQAEVAARNLVTHARRKGDPYIEID